jgi:HxlR-like helix-turn-helix protein
VARIVARTWTAFWCRGPLSAQRVGDRCGQPLRAVERDGLVDRTVYPAVPVRVEYELTPLGQTLREPLKMLTEWSVRHVTEVLAAREEYDARAERAN